MEKVCAQTKLVQAAPWEMSGVAHNMPTLPKSNISAHIISGLGLF